MAAVLNLIPPVLTGQIIDKGLIGRNMNLLIRLILLSFAVILAANLAGLLQTYLTAWIAQHISFDLRNQLFYHLELMPYQFFTSNNQGDIITQMTSDIDSVESVIESTFSSAGPMLIYLAGGILLIRGDAGLTVGDITVLVALLGKMYGPVNQLLNIQVDWIRSMASFTRIFSSLDLPISIMSPDDAVKPDSASGRVCFSHVNFSYNRDAEILKDISFTLNPGSSIALVGASGAGKSSIIQLIPRLYDVTEGSVTFDGIDVRKLDLFWLRNNIGIVTQDTYLFNGTLRENLLYARPDATEEDMIKACRQADIYHFIEKLPEGLETPVGNRGLELSGGERQRVSIARILLKDPALLIFDEATSSLDSISEASIQKAIVPLIRTRTSIIIAHRLSTIQSADTILVIEKGRIVERGSHEELLDQGGVYAHLYKVQYEKEENTAETDKPDSASIES